MERLYGHMSNWFVLTHFEPNLSSYYKTLDLEIAKYRTLNLTLVSEIHTKTIRFLEKLPLRAFLNYIKQA